METIIKIIIEIVGNFEKAHWRRTYVLHISNTPPIQNLHQFYSWERRTRCSVQVSHIICFPFIF